MHKRRRAVCGPVVSGRLAANQGTPPIRPENGMAPEHEAFAAWYAKQKGWDLEEGFRLEMLSYDSGKQLAGGHEHGALGNRRLQAIPALTASLDNQAEIIAIGNTNPWPPASMHARTAPSSGIPATTPFIPKWRARAARYAGKPSCAPQAPPRTIPCTSGWKPSA